MAVSEVGLKQRQQASRKHGEYAFRRRGDDALEPSQISALSELRELVETNPGRLELRKELTARMALICEIGFSYLREQVEDGEDIWAGGIINRLSTYVAETRRLLDSFSDDTPKGSAVEIIAQAMTNDGKNS
jgi:hypothetical protein